jgi:hypothetical protein
MPIRGLTDRGASFPQIGTLRKGAPKVDEKRPGQDLKHFRFDSDDTDAAERFRTVYGDEPTSIRVFLPFRTAAENFEAWQEHWTAGALQHRCDGETCVLWLTPRNTYSQEAKPCPHLSVDKAEKNRCKPTGRLKVIIPELRRLAYVTVLTSSLHDIMGLTGQLEAIESMRGDLRGIPMILRRQPREISTPSGTDGKRRRLEKWLLSIEAAPTWVDLQLQAQEQAALPAPRALLPAPPADPFTGEIVDADEDEPQPAPVKRTRRDALLDRIAELTVQAEQEDLEVQLLKPLEQMSDEELIQHGKNLKAAIDEAARSGEPVPTPGELAEAAA